MRTRSIILVITIFLSSLLFTACSNSATKADEMRNGAQTAVNNGQAAVNNAVRNQQIEANIIKQERARDWGNFKNEMNAQIEQNKARIAELRKRAAEADAKDRARLNSEIDKLDKQNEESRNKLEEADQKLLEKLTAQDKEAQEKAAAFQKEFRQKMDELTNELKDLAPNNSK